jgi:hypothetical protein
MRCVLPPQRFQLNRRNTLTLLNNSNYNIYMPSRKFLIWLITGDTLALLLLSVIGYLNHYAGREAFGFRWLTTFLPLCLGWALAAIPMGLYTPPIAGNWRQAAWRGLAAAFLAAPFATMLRGMLLGAAVVPIFMVVLSAFGGLAMMLWRGAWAWFTARKRPYG